MFWASDGAVPEIRRVSPGRAVSGHGWMGLRQNGDYVVTGFSELPLMPGWFWAYTRSTWIANGPPPGRGSPSERGPGFTRPDAPGGGCSSVYVGGGPLTAGDLVLEPGRHEARVGDHVLALTPTEFRLLEALVRAWPVKIETLTTAQDCR